MKKVYVAGAYSANNIIDCLKKPRKKVDYKGFVMHIWEWNEKGISWGMSDLRELSKKYNVPIPKEYR